MMNNDIVPELLDDIIESFENGYESNENIRELLNKLFEKKSTHIDSNDYAIQVGEELTKAFSKHLIPENLPSGKMYYNIAQRILTPTLTNNYELVSDYAATVQEQKNIAAGYNLKSIKPKLNEDRINGFIERLATDEFENSKWLLQDPIVNFSQSVVDDTIKENAEFHYKSGIKAIL